MKYIIPDHISGNTWDGISTITILEQGSAVNLTGCDAKMQVRLNNNISSPVYLELSTEDDTIELTFPDLGCITIPPCLVNLPPGKYYYGLMLTFPCGYSQTYLEGEWKILPSTVRKSIASTKMEVYKKYIYFGADEISEAPNTSDDIKGLSNYHPKSYNGFGFDITIPTGTKRIVIAYPSQLRDLTDISFRNFGNVSIIDRFLKKTINVTSEGSNGIISVPYKVYYYIPTVSYGASVTYDVII